MLRTAIEILDEGGLEGLTLQEIGSRLGKHHTAVYRYFRSRDELLAEVIAYLLAAIAIEAALSDDPRERIIDAATGLRAMFREHPAASTVMMTIGGQPAESLGSTRIILDAMRELGVPDKQLLRSYQALESYVIGACLFDFSGAPDHLEMRRQRFAATGDPTLAKRIRSVADVDRLNEEAFTWGLRALLERIASTD